MIKIAGRFWKSKTDNLYLIEIPLLNLLTQATNKEEIPEAVIDAIELLADDPTVKLTVEIIKNALYVEANDFKKMISLILKRQRQKRKLTLAQVTKRINASSINKYAQYEQAKFNPGIETFSQLLHSIDPDLKPYLSLVPSKK